MEFGRFDPTRAMKLLRDEVDSLFDRFVEKPLGIITGQVIPPLDVSESDTDIIIKAELPGIEETDVEISVQNDVLTLRGQKKEDRDPANRIYLVTERATGNFARTVRLPAQVRVDMVHATMKKGVLEIILPKKELAQAKKIEIKLEGS